MIDFKRTNILVVGLCCFTFLCGGALADAINESVALTNTQGRTIDVYLQKVTKTEVTVKLAKNHKTHTLKLADLDAASRGKIEKWKSEGGGLSTDFDIEFDSRRTSRARNSDGDSRTLTLKPVVTIENGNNNLETKPMEVTVITLGRPIGESSTFDVFQHEKHELPTIGGGGEYIIQCKKYEGTYDNHGYKHGSKYLGYVVLIHQGKDVVEAKSVPTYLAEKFGNSFLDLKAGKTYDKHLQDTEE